MTALMIFKAQARWAVCSIMLASSPAHSQESATLSFGRVGPDQPVSQVIEFDNDSGRLLEVEHIRLTPPFRAEDITTTILPDGQGSFRLILGEERVPGPYEGTISVEFKGAAWRPITFNVEGYVIPPIEFRPRSFFRIATHAGAQRRASLEIINHRDEPLNILSAEEASERFSVQLETIEEGQHYRLNLLLNGSAAPGKQTDRITLHAQPPTSEPLIVTADTWIRERVYHFPDSVDMGRLPLAIATDNDAVQQLAQTLMVYRPGTDDFEVIARVDVPFIAISSERGPDGDRYQITLTLMPERLEPGPIHGQVIIETNDEAFPMLKVPIQGGILPAD